MKKCFLRYAALCGMVASLLFLGGTEAQAQRTVRGQSFISADFVTTLSPVLSRDAMGAEAWYGRYLDVIYWQAGFQYMPGYVKDGERRAPGCFTLAGGAMYRMFATRNRMFNCYVGGNALFGVEFADGDKAVADIIKDPVSGTIPVDTVDDEQYSTMVTYGVEPRFEVEFFPLKSVALVAGLSLPVKVQTQKDHVAGRVSAGVRVNF